MENYRSQSCKDGRMESYKNGGFPSGMKDLRSYSTTHVQVHDPNPNPNPNPNPKMKKGKQLGRSSSKNWNFNDAELQRKKRVAGYKVYAVEGKMKGSLKKSFRWIKHTCTQVVHGFT